MKPAIICLMGPTASGKTPLAVDIVQHLPCEIISVDSAMVYRGMDIGTAKPTAEILQIAPHRLIDIVDPAIPYSAGKFREDALRHIAEIHANKKIPLLVGGTMMYFRILQQGMAALPRADKAIRERIESQAKQTSWEVLHQQLQQFDPAAAQRIHPNDSQRIQRALEVYELTGKTITQLQQQDTSPLADYTVYNFALAPAERKELHDRIAHRLQAMLDEGFVEEVKKLHRRGDLNATMPSIRSVGYRQVWEYLEGECDYQTMQQNILAATRQLAKRQLTWLRSWPDVTWSSEPRTLVSAIKQVL